MFSDKQLKFIYIFEKVLFIGLCGLSVLFIKGVLEQYISRKTSFTQSQLPITELPTITICFSESQITFMDYGGSQVKCI